MLVGLDLYGQVLLLTLLIPETLDRKKEDDLGSPYLTDIMITTTGTSARTRRYTKL
jgi:hypothetical protein